MKYKKIVLKCVFSVFFLSTIIGTMSAQAFSTVATQSVSTVTVLVDGFDLAGDTPISNYVWDVKASRFATKTDDKPFPQKSYIPYKPFILPQSLHAGEDEELRIVGVRAAFNIKGNNKVDLIPTDQSKIDGKLGVYTYSKDGKNFSRGDVIPGIYINEPIVRIGVYVLGLLREYFVEVEFETFYGTPFSVRLGDLNYRGWGILEGEVPFSKYVKQRDLNNDYLLKMNKISVRTGSGEIVTDFTLYFDGLFYVRPIVSSQEELYDGYDLSRPGVEDTFEWETTGLGQ